MLAALTLATAVGCLTITEGPRAGCTCFDKAGKPVTTYRELCPTPEKPKRLERLFDDNRGPSQAE